MSLKRLLLTMLLVCLALWPAAALSETTGIANQIPILYISDATDAVDALMDDDASTAWYGTPDTANWTVLTASSTVKEIWVRVGARADARSYLAAGRPTLMEVTVYHGGQQVSTYRYHLLDVYAADNARDWVDGYQRLLLPWAMDGVFCIELKVLGSVQGLNSAEIALSDILLSSGQPSPRGSGVQMRASAPTVSPASATLPPIINGSETVSPTSTPQGQSPSGTIPTSPPVSGDGAGVAATLLQGIGVRTGPGAGYDYVGSYFKGGETVQVVSKVWDPVNTLYWLQVDFVAKGGYHYRGYCVREKRVDIDPSLVPDDPSGTPATVTERTGGYYGPGTDYRAHKDHVSAGTKGNIFAWENGYVLFEWMDKSKDVRRRAWLPESAVSQ